jgi:hypothetical protein
MPLRLQSCGGFMRRHYRWIVLALLGACAATPRKFEATSAASLEARTAQEADVTSSLAEDELRESPDGGAEHHHHAH